MSVNKHLETYSHQAKELLKKAVDIASEKKYSSVQTIHLLKSMVLVTNSVPYAIFLDLGINITKVQKELDIQLSKQTRVLGSNQVTPLSKDLILIIEKASQLKEEMGDVFTTGEHLLLGIISKKGDTANKILEKLGLDRALCISVIQKLRKGSRASSPDAESNYQALEKYAENLTKLAQKNKLDPVIGREDEIRRVLEILSRRTKSNPILLGPPGVGKTAIVEAIAHRIASGDVPDTMRNRTIMALDMGKLLAGTKYQGAFEERLKKVIQEAENPDYPTILFIDEIHTLRGAGSSGGGAMDAANLLKPALARGTLKTIAATTDQEYRQHFAKDRALERRFLPIRIEEPTPKEAITILRGIKVRYETYHSIQIKDSAIIAAVNLSNRYITDRFLPDKAIDLIDEAAAKCKVARSSQPQELQKLQQELSHLHVAREAKRRDNDSKKEELFTKEIEPLQKKYDELKASWENKESQAEEIAQQEKKIQELEAEEIQAQRKFDYRRVAEIRYEKLVKARKRLEKLKKLLPKSGIEKSQQIDEEDISLVVSQWTKIPLTKMLQSEKERILHLDKELKEHIAGQPRAIATVTQAIQRHKAGLQDPNKPLSFIFLGSTGVGKTALSKVLAKVFLGDIRSLIRIDLSEYQERHTVSRLLGAPPGYVGYEQGGTLTEKVRKQPYSILLFDEMEKAHPDIFNILLQLLDEGHLTDNRGNLVNFKNTIVILTSNIGAEVIQKYRDLLMQENRDDVIEKMGKEMISKLEQQFRPEFLNRINSVIAFPPPNLKIMEKILDIRLKELHLQLLEQQITLKLNLEVKAFLIKKGYNPEFGARPLGRALEEHLLNPLATFLLQLAQKPKVPIVASLSKKGTITFDARAKNTNK